MDIALPRPRPWLVLPAALAGIATIGRRHARARREADERRPAEVGFMRAMHNAFRGCGDRLGSQIQ